MIPTSYTSIVLVIALVGLLTIVPHLFMQKFLFIYFLNSFIPITNCSIPNVALLFMNERINYYLMNGGMSL